MSKTTPKTRPAALYEKVAEVRLMIKRLIPGLDILGRLNLNNSNINSRMPYDCLPEEVKAVIPMLFTTNDGIKGIRWPVGFNSDGEMIYQYEWWEMDSQGRKRFRKSERKPGAGDLVI